MPSRNAPRQVLSLAVVACLLLGPGAPAALAVPDEELQVQAAFLYNFVKFCTWPDDAAEHPPTLVMGVLGHNPFGGALDSLRGAVVKNRAILVQDVVGVDAARRCQLLYVPRSAQDLVPAILSGLAERPVLTVSESPGFARAGGVIEFVIVSDTVKFKVNVEAARRNNLKLSSQLLGVAIEIVKN